MTVRRVVAILRGRAPWGLIVAAGLVALIELIFAKHDLDFTRFYIHDWKSTSRAAVSSTKDCAVLCLGDSLVKFGVIPRVIEDRLGVPVYNLAVCDGQAASSFYLFERAIRSGARPKAVVVDFAPHLLATDPRHNLRQWPELLDARTAIDLALGTKHAGFAASVVLGSLFPSFKARHEIRTAVFAALRGEPASRRTEIEAFVRHWRDQRGAQVCPERPTYQGDVDLENRAYFPKQWRCHPSNVRYIERLLKLAASHGVTVYWLLPPVVPQFQARADELGLAASYTEFVQRFVARSDNVIVLDGRHAGYGHPYFIDPLHLNAGGAAVLSGEVAKAIAGPTRDRNQAWVSLPSASNRPVNVAFRLLDPADPLKKGPVSVSR